MPGKKHYNIQFYKDNLDCYMAHVKNTNIHRLEGGIVCNLITKHFNKSDLSIIDGGCGPGITINHALDGLLGKYNATIDAIDSSKSALDAYRSNFEKRPNLLGDIHHGTIEDTVIKKKYDVLLAIHSLYSYDITKIKKLYDLVDNNGIGIITMQSKDGDMIKVMNLSELSSEKIFEDVAGAFKDNGISTNVSYHEGHLDVTDIIKEHMNENAKKLMSWLMFTPYDQMSEELRENVKNLTRKLSTKKNDEFYLCNRSGLLVFTK